jgi:hypothetical protein
MIVCGDGMLVAVYALPFIPPPGRRRETSQPQAATSVATIAPPMIQRAFVLPRPVRRLGQSLYFGSWGTAVPHRGQWVQSAASAFLHCP